MQIVNIVFFLFLKDDIIDHRVDSLVSRPYWPLVRAHKLVWIGHVIGNYRSHVTFLTLLQDLDLLLQVLLFKLHFLFFHLLVVWS